MKNSFFSITAFSLLVCLTGCTWTTPVPEKKEEAKAPPVEKIVLRRLPAPALDSLPHTRLPRMVVVPMAEQPPAMDGNLAAKCWTNAAKAEGFTVLNQIVERAALALQPSLRPWEYGPALGMRSDERGDILPVESTTALLCYDHTALYVAFKCTDSQVVTTVQQPDGPVWMDDCVELFIDPQAPGSPLYHIALTTRGTKFDEKFQQDASASPKATGAPPIGRRWDCKMSFITGKSKEGWWAQMAIPFESLGLKWPDPGTVWTLNLARWNSPPLLHSGMEFNEISAWSPAGASPGESASFGRLYFGKAPAAVVERLLPGRCAEGVNTAEVALRDLSGKGTRARVVLSTQTESGDLIETTSQDVALEPGGAQTIQLNYKIPPAVRKCYLAATLLSQPRARVIDGLEMALEAPEKEVALEMAQSDFIRGRGPIRAVVDINKGSVSVGAYGLKVEVLREKNVLADCVIERLDSQRVEVVIQDPSLTPGSYMLRARLLEDKKVAAEATKDMEILKGPFDK